VGEGLMVIRRSAAPKGWFPQRGEVCLVALDKHRPALVVSTNALNRFSLDICVVPITTSEHKHFSVRPLISAGEGGLQRTSWAKCDQVTTVEKNSMLYPPLGRLSRSTMQVIEQSLRIALELD
jgi:mRNA interferase MazF